MKIAMIGQKGYPAHYGGVERHVAEISKRLIDAGHEVTVYNRAWYSKRTTTADHVVRVTTIPTIRTKHLDAIVHTFLSSFHAIYSRADVIHYHGVGPSLVSFIPRIFSRARVITTFHCIDRHHQKWNWFARTMLRLGEKTACLFAHETIAVSRGIQQYCKNEFRHDTTYIPNGITVQNLETQPQDSVLDTFGLSKGNYILMVSRLVPHKGAHVLIESFQQLKKDAFFNPKVQALKLVIVGGSAFTDDYIQSLHMQAAPSNDIVFTDYQSGNALQTLFRDAAFFVHPSLNEGLPITVLEAMSFGKLALVSAIPEHLEVMKDARMTFRENDAVALKERLMEIVEMHETEIDAIGSANKLYVEESYNWDTIMLEIEALYKKHHNSLHKSQAAIAA